MNNRKTFIKVFAVLGSLLLVAGIAVFIIGMTTADWDFTMLNTVRYTQKSYEAEGEITSLRVEYSDASISVEYSETAKTVHIDYPVRLNERDEEVSQIQISEKDGTLSLVEHVEWEKNLFQWSLGNSPAVRVVLPAGQNIALDLYTQNGSISLNADGEALPSLALHSNNGSISVSGTLTVAEDAAFQTDNGSVNVSGVSAAGDLTLRTSNGSVRLADIAAADSLTAKTAHGSVELFGNVTAKTLTASTSSGDIAMRDGKIDAQEIAMATEYGNIEANGSAFAGAQSDYTVLVSTDVGDSNVSDSAGGSRKLTLSTDTGSIRIFFQK